MRAYLAPFLLAALPASALAQPLTGLFSWQVSRDGVAWSSSITINPGDTYHIRGAASWTDAAEPTVGFAFCTFEQIDLIGADASDIFGGASGPGTRPAYLIRRQAVPETWSIQAGAGASVLGLKIDNLNPTQRTNLGQLPKLTRHGYDPTFVSDNPAVFFLMDAVAGDPKTLIISSTWTRLGTPASNEFKVYTTETGTNKKPVQEADLTPAVVTIIPAPATLSLLALTPSLRRRRSHPSSRE